MEWIWVAAGGAIGSCLRYALGRGLAASPLRLPLATLTANVLAGFLIGFFAGVERRTAWPPPRLKLFWTTGLLGGLSTFSTFSLETCNLLLARHWGAAALNAAANLLLSLAGVALGMAAARLLLGARQG